MSIRQLISLVLMSLSLAIASIHFYSFLLMSLSIALASKLPTSMTIIVYQSVAYLQVQAKVTLKVTNKNVY